MSTTKFVSGGVVLALIVGGMTSLGQLSASAAEKNAETLRADEERAELQAKIKGPEEEIGQLREVLRRFKKSEYEHCAYIAALKKKIRTVSNDTTPMADVMKASTNTLTVIEVDEMFFPAGEHPGRGRLAQWLYCRLRHHEC